MNSNLSVNISRGLQTTNALVDLGSSSTLSVDYTVVPDLAATNVFAADNTIQGVLSLTSTAAATSQSTGALIVGGGVGIAGDLYANNAYMMSDARLKEQIVEIPDALDVVMGIRGCTFVWNGDERNAAAHRAGQKTVGVIAQDVVQAGASLVVHMPEDVDGEGRMAVEYSKLVPYLIESVKSLKRKIDALEETQATVTKQARR